MQTLRVDLILAVIMAAVFLIALRGRKIGWGEGFPGSRSLATFFEFVYYLFCVGMLIAILHIADVRPWSERMTVIGWPILIAVSVWLIGSYLPTRLVWRTHWSLFQSAA